MYDSDTLCPETVRDLPKWFLHLKKNGSSNVMNCGS